MSIKRKKYNALKTERDQLMSILNETRLIIEMPQSPGYVGDFSIPAMMQLMNISLFQMHQIAKFGGYDNHTTEVIHGPFAIRFVTETPANGWDHFLYHRYMDDGRIVITKDFSDEIRKCPTCEVTMSISATRGHKCEVKENNATA